MLGTFIILLILVLVTVFAAILIAHIWRKEKQKHPLNEQKGFWAKMKTFFRHY